MNSGTRIAPIDYWIDDFRSYSSGWRYSSSLRRAVTAIVHGGLMFALVVVVAPSAARAQTETVLYSFLGGTSGNFPEASLLMDGGNLYGTTYGSNGTSGYGTVFKVTKAGKEILLYAFAGGTDGVYPSAGLVADAGGNLYGTTSGGGAYGDGTVFKIAPDGKETLLYSFTGKTDGAAPQGSLVLDSKGNLYGATPYGGATAGSESCGIGCGAVFRVTPAGKETVLYSFTGGADGGYPFAGLVLDAGNLYGIAYGGGTFNLGAVFKVTLAGKETVLHSFAGGVEDGEMPEGNLLRDSKGNLYGVTFMGGSSTNCSSGCGTVYKLSPTGALTVLYNFTDGTDGGHPGAGLIADTVGNLYGTTPFGGSSSFTGTVFEVTPHGTETVLYSFSGGADGSEPAAGLVRDAKGDLYGTTSMGGNSACPQGCGVVFKVVP